MYTHAGHWSANKRIAFLAIGLAVLLALAGLAAWWTGRSETHRSAVPGPANSSSAPSPAHPPAGGTGTVAPPAKISDPLAYGKAAAQVLWTYDTRTTSHTQHLAGLRAWVTQETKYADWPGIQALIPDPVLWTRMHDNAQHAEATVTESRFPSSFKQALAEDPTTLTTAYIYAVTVTGKQQISWNGGGAGAEDRSVTLAVQCRPGTDCSLVAISPRVLP
ncbi:hypothetical protein OTB20_18900 [Streptomyces sp. H27-H1]|uniref:hypothetical protein n=1 Tax=Streptomyces sp. H27-H1 TaxID=2996461 RepID=UPI0022714A8A|nr:hypothetical protein [Streptomyces sp. H27-H1]MCY0928227.1 hypothetical protein [Streptomyces sp. H27-H1]